MAMNIYGKKIREDNRVVIYEYGRNFDNLTGRLQIEKKSFELTKIRDSNDKLDNIFYFKIGCKLIKLYKSKGTFPNSVESVS